MNEETTKISSRTWSRMVDPVVKAGFMDGAADGQTSTFQSSFDVGYSQGFKFGLQMGFIQGLSSGHDSENSPDITLQDSRRINCQLCINGTMMQEKIDNLYNKQEENNDDKRRKCFQILQRKLPLQ